MTQTLVRHFVIQAQPQQLLWLADQAQLAPKYLNFLTDIRQSASSKTSKLIYEKEEWRRYKVWVQYRNLLKAHGFVYVRVDRHNSRVLLEHDGKLAEFEAAFLVEPGLVTLTCHYEAKIPFVSWLISKLLDRLLAQVAAAMDRFAASITLGPR